MSEKLTEKQFQTVWTQAVGMDGYDKKMFQKLHRKMKRRGLVMRRIIKKPKTNQVDEG